MKNTLAFLLLITLSVSSVSFAEKGGNGRGKPPPEPTDCNDEFPGFIYSVGETRKRPAEVHLSSVGVTHVTEDWSNGVMVWSEYPGNGPQATLMRQDFKVEGKDNSTPGDIDTLLPRSGEVIPSGDALGYFAVDVWGDTDHTLLYMAVVRTHGFGDYPEDKTQELLIYNLHDMDDFRLIHLTEGSDWTTNWTTNCLGVDYPQFVLDCYLFIEVVTFNQSGTRLYLNIRKKIDGERLEGTSRINIDRFDGAGNELPLKDWSFSSPELIFTAFTGPPGPQPESDRYNLPFPELIAGPSGLVDADLCATLYAELALGDKPADPEDLWQTFCTVPGNFITTSPGDSWQSPDALLTTILTNRGRKIYRRYIDGSEELLIENGRSADTGR